MTSIFSWIRISILLLAIRPCWAATVDWQALPTRFVNNQILIQVTTTDEHYWLLFDTGSQHSYISQRLAASLGLPVAKMSSDKGGRHHVAYVHKPTLVIGDQEVRLPHCWVSDIIDDVFGVSVDGILGCDFAQRMAIMISYENQRLEVSRKVDEASIAQMERIDLNGGDLPYITARLFGRDGFSHIDVPLLLNTGSALTIGLYGPDDQLEAILGDKVGEVGMAAATGDVTFALHTGGRIQLGGVSLDDVPLAFASPNPTMTQPHLGAYVLARFEVIIDLQHNVVYLGGTESTSRPLLVWVAGFSLEKDEGLRGELGSVRVARVVAGSPADKGGVLVGDVIISLDGVAAENLGKSNLEFDGSEVELLVLRNGKELFCRVTPKVQFRP